MSISLVALKSDLDEASLHDAVVSGDIQELFQVTFVTTEGTVEFRNCSNVTINFVNMFLQRQGVSEHFQKEESVV